MPYIVIFLLIILFFKGFYYGLYEIKNRKNFSGGIAVCVLAILRTCISNFNYFNILYYLKKITSLF